MSEWTVQLGGSANGSKVSAKIKLDYGSASEVETLLGFVASLLTQQAPIQVMTAPSVPLPKAEKAVGSPKPAKTLPLVNGERANLASVGAKLTEAFEKSETPEHWQTGIKVDSDGVKRYKCRIFCKNPACRQRMNTYLIEDEEIAECYHCKSLHRVRPVSEERLARDEWGNYFIADELIETIASQDDINWDEVDQVGE